MKIKLDLSNENDTDKIRYLGYINQTSSKLLWVCILILILNI